MDILFVTSDPALASAVKGTLESARHTVSAASDVDSLAGAWPHGTPMDLVIIDDLSAHDLLDETRRSLSRLMDGKAGDGLMSADAVTMPPLRDEESHAPHLARQ